jgi:type II secretory pathway component GspD/PulD (secretin)
MKRTLLVFIMVLSWAVLGHAQQTVLEVIQLNYRNADQIIPMLKPLLAPGGTISGMQNRVIVRTTPENLAELRKVLDMVDNAPRRLLISVKQDSAGSGTLDEAEISGSIGTDRARVTVPGTGSQQGGTAQIKRGDDKVQARVLRSQSATTDRSVQTVQVLEGNEAFINVGQSVAIPSGGVTVTPSGTTASQSSEYRDVGTGFRVRPRVNGNNVTLEISTRRDSLGDPNAQSFDVQRVDTVISGRLGQWMELGGIGQSSTQYDSGTVSRRSSTGTDDRRVLLKVDEMP